MMKKLILFFVAVLFAANVSAQQGAMVLSGTLDISSGTEMFGETGVDVTTILIAPSFQYFLSDRFSLGAQVGLSTTSLDIEGFDDRLNVVLAGVFARYYLLRTERFGIFGQLNVGAGFANEAAGDLTVVGIDVVPGIQYFINSRWSVEAHLAPVLAFSSTIFPGDEDSVNTFNAGFNRVAPLAVGFSFHF